MYPFNPSALDYGAGKRSSQSKAKQTTAAQPSDGDQAEDLA